MAGLSDPINTEPCFSKKTIACFFGLVNHQIWIGKKNVYRFLHCDRNDGTHEIDFPKGVKARFINLKCWRPNGIPTMVMQSRIPKNKWVKAIQKPPQQIQIKFMMVERQPVFDEVSVILTPNGARPTMANLKHWIPKGIPTMVRQRIKPPIMYSKKIKMPPKMIQMMLPKKFIVFVWVKISKFAFCYS